MASVHNRGCFRHPRFMNPKLWGRIRRSLVAVNADFTTELVLLHSATPLSILARFLDVHAVHGNLNELGRC
jgi:hypothetical protein